MRKIRNGHKFPVMGFFLTMALTYWASTAIAVVPAVLPGPADINRIAPQSTPPPPPVSKGTITIEPSPAPGTPIPKNAKNIHFVLRGVVFEHVTAFRSEQLKALYEPYIGKKVALSVAWQIADELTAKYRQEGYFLSRAFVPAQEMSKGLLRIRAVEGAISDVTLTGAEVPDFPAIQKAINTITSEKPARLQTLERQLLLLNDLPGLSFQATLAPASQKDGAARLILTVAKTKGVTTLIINNSGSRYIGPYEASAGWSGSLLPLQQTDLSILSAPQLSSRDGKLISVNGTHRIQLTAASLLDLTAGYSNAVPGYTLKVNDIVSRASNGGIGISYRLMRQRQQNLSTRLAVDFRNSDTDILHTVLNRDRIRAVQWGLNYDGGDRLSGHNYLDVQVRHGLPFFGSSREGDPNLSRPDVHPDFTKLQVNYTRLQSLTNSWTASLVVSGQKASGALFSSEEFGFGGTALGRAYDTSEISGDDGLAASLELHFQSLPPWGQVTFTPYVFYDIGKVWQLYSNPGQTTRLSAASAGPGFSLQAPYGLSGNFYAAQPLTRDIATPLHSGNNHSPRFSFQLMKKF